MLVQDLFDSVKEDAATAFSDNRVIDQERNIDNYSAYPARLFALFPTPGLQWRFIKIDTKNLSFFVPERNFGNLDYDSGLDAFYGVSDFTKFKGLKIQK